MRETPPEEMRFEDSEPAIGANRRRSKEYLPGEIVGIDPATGTIACRDKDNPDRIIVVRFNRHNPADALTYANIHGISPVEMGLAEYLHHMEDEAS